MSVMTRERFLDLTASSQWLTVPQLLRLLDLSEFWDDFWTNLTPVEKWHYVSHAINDLVDEDGIALFQHMVTPAGDGTPQVVVKQIRLFTNEDHDRFLRYNHALNRLRRETAARYHSI